MVAAVNDGVAISQLARQYGVDDSTVRDHLSRPRTKRRSPALTGQEVLLATQLYRTGTSFRGIGKQLGVHASTVRQYLLKAGIQPRDRGSQ